MKVKGLLAILKGTNPDYDVYIPVYMYNRRALYGQGFEGSEILESSEIILEVDKKALCLNCSIEETNKILEGRQK